MTYEEAIITLKTESCTDCSYGCDSPINCTCEGCKLKTAAGIAIEAIEKQIQKKPDFEGDGFDDNGNIIYDTWICPCCEKRYETDYEEHDVCPNCGQAIDWE